MIYHLQNQRGHQGTRESFESKATVTIISRHTHPNDHQSWPTRVTKFDLEPDYLPTSFWFPGLAEIKKKKKKKNSGPFCHRSTYLGDSGCQVGGKNWAERVGVRQGIISEFCGVVAWRMMAVLQVNFQLVTVQSQSCGQDSEEYYRCL